MPRPLLHLAVLALMAGATVQVMAASGLGWVNISTCPITYFGKTYDSIYISKLTPNTLTVSFGDGDALMQQSIIRISAATEVSVNFETRVDPTEVPVGSPLHSKLPNITTPARCSVNLVGSFSFELVKMEIFSFGTQAALKLSTSHQYNLFNRSVTLNIQIKNTVSEDTFNTTGKTLEVYRDLSGCRQGDKIYAVNEVVRSTPETCQVEMCDANAVITNVSACGSPAWCHGNGQCLLSPTMCTVTGSTIIDLQGNARPPVRSRCGYTLLQPRVGGGQKPVFAVVAVFRERRRRDVPLLDRVMLFLTERRTVISLEQGGRVQVNNETMPLGPSPRLVQGVVLSKSEAGVTATILFSKNSIPVMFNGFTVHVDMTGYDGPEVQGLCGGLGGSSTSSDETEFKSPLFHEPGCETQYNDSADSTIDCRAATARCDLLRQEPFTACNKHVDPEPYITACTDTLCRYPAVDDVHCQLMEAYATACQSHSNDTLSGWRSKARC